MSREVKLYLDDILGATLKIEAYTKNQSLDTLLADPLRADAVTFNLLIIGEAAGKLPADEAFSRAQRAVSNARRLKDDTSR